jgi:hypothetical protein
MLEGLIIGCLPAAAGLIIAACRYQKLEPRWFRLFPWFLLITILFEFGGYAYSFVLKAGSNHFIYNTNTFIEYNFYLLVFYLAVSGHRQKKLLLLLIGCFLLSYVIFVFITGSFLVYNSQAINTGELLTLIACVIYLAELLMAEQQVNFFSIPMFWITTGILIAVVGDFLYIALFDYILSNKLDPNGDIYGVISITLSDIEYSMVSIGLLSTFLWKKHK